MGRRSSRRNLGPLGRVPRGTEKAIANGWGLIANGCRWRGLPGRANIKGKGARARPRVSALGARPAKMGPESGARMRKRQSLPAVLIFFKYKEPFHDVRLPQTLPGLGGRGWSCRY